MAKSNIVITSTNSQGKTLQKTLTDINPNATNSQLATFGNMLNQLTTNVYGHTTKITKVNCDTEANPPARFGPIKVYRLGDLENECTSLTFDQLNNGWQNTFFPIIYEGNSSNLVREVNPDTAAVYPRIGKVANGVPSANQTGDIDLSDLTIDGKKVNYFAILEKEDFFQPHTFEVVIKADDAKFTLSITNE